MGWRWLVAAVVLLPLIALGLYPFWPPAPPPETGPAPRVPAREPALDQTGIERRVAERFRNLKVAMNVIVNDQEIQLAGGAPLPAEPFTVRFLQLNGNVDASAIPWLADLSQLYLVSLPPKGADLWAEALAKHRDMFQINASGSDLSDRGLAHIGRLTNLMYLNLHGCPRITGAGLQKLAGCTSLKEVNLDSAMLQAGKYTRADLEELRQALPRLAFVQDNLEPIPEASSDPDRPAALWLRSLGPIRVDVTEGNGVGTRIIAPDQPLPAGPFRLVGVSLRGDEVNNLGDGLAEKLAVRLKGVRLTQAYLPQTEKLTTPGVARLVELPIFVDLSYLNLSNCGVDDGVFAHLAKLPKLYNIDAASLPKVTGKGIGALKACPGLQHLTLLDAPLAAEGIEEMQQLAALEYLNLSEVPCTEQHAAALAKLKLNTLIVANAGIDDTMAARLAGLRTLTRLSLPANPLTDKGLAEFKKLKELKSLDVSATQVTAAGVMDLQKALPECKIQRE